MLPGKELHEFLDVVIHQVDAEHLADRTQMTKFIQPTRSTIRKLPSWPPTARPWCNFAYVIIALHSYSAYNIYGVPSKGFSLQARSGPRAANHYHSAAPEACVG